MDDYTTRTQLFSFLACLCLMLFSGSPALSDTHEVSTSPKISLHADNSTINSNETSSASSEQEDVVGYVEGCTGGAAVGSIVPGIGTIIGGIVGCGLAWFW